MTYITETERGYGKAVAKAIPLTLKPAEPSQINVETPPTCRAYARLSPRI